MAGLLMNIESATAILTVTVALMIKSNISFVDATSIKMDFLPLANVRTDPIVAPTCLADHVHTFYGAANIYPHLTYDDLVSTTDNSGNVEENKSLYWHPTVYRYDPDTQIYTRDTIWFSSAYYIWTTGQAKAFPHGFRMIAGTAGQTGSRAFAECVGQSACERTNCESSNNFFPKEACWELEVSMRFPTCWDGVNLDSEDHMSHVSYDEYNGEFDGDCPASHPVRIPQIQLFFRILEYDGGHHTFSHGDEGTYHADYVSGWDESELQYVLDNCENESEAANPDAWCEDFLTFRDAPKNVGDENIVEKLQAFQPNPPLDTSDVTTEAIDGVTTLPRGICTGTCLTCGQSPVTEPVEPPAPSPVTEPIEPPEPSPVAEPIQPPVPSPVSEPEAVVFIYNFRTNIKEKKSHYIPKIQIVIRDGNNNKIQGAYVSLEYSFTHPEEGLITETEIKATKGSGKVVLNLGKIPLDTPVQIKILSITIDGYSYDDSKNKILEGCPVLSSECPIMTLQN